MKSKSLIWFVAGVLLILVLVQGVQAAEAYGYVTQWGVTGTGDGQFTSPYGIAADSSGNVYVSDGRIQRFTSGGIFQNQWDHSNGYMVNPWGLSVDSSGLVYNAEGQDTPSVIVYQANGAHVRHWVVGSKTGQTPVEFSSPRGVGVNSIGEVYVVSPSNNLIQIYSPSGTKIGDWGNEGTSAGLFDSPEGIAVDNVNNVYVADTGNNRIQKFTSTGTPLTQWGSAGTGHSQFAFPQGIAVDSAGNVYVADTGNNRIQKFTSTGTYLTQWGLAGTGNGEFNTPKGIAVDTVGNVYVADTGNNRIQKFELIPITVTAAGDQSYYFGEEIKLSGTNTETSTTYLFIMGPSPWPSGGARLNADPKNSPVTDTFAASFTQAAVTGGTWSFDWQLDETMADSLDPGTYAIYAVTQPRDKNNLPSNIYQTVSIILKRPFISAFFDQGNGPIGTVFTINGVKSGSPDPVFFTMTNNSAPFMIGSLPVEGVKPEDFSIVSTTGNVATFGSAPVQTDATFSYIWNTGSLAGGSLLQGTEYGFVVSNHPLNIPDQFASPLYSDYSLKLLVRIDGVHADYTVDKTSCNAPCTVAFTDISTGIPSPITQWSINYGDGVTDLNLERGITKSHTYSSSGVYVPEISATNGIYSDSRTGVIIGVAEVHPPAPAVTLITPASGPSIGGTKVTITGIDLTGATAVTFGTTSGSIQTNTATEITATSPAHAGGEVDVTVTTPSGTSAIVAGDKFTYLTGKSGAVAYAIDKDFGGDPAKPENKEKELQVSDGVLPAGTELKLGNGQTCPSVAYDAWVDTTNNNKNANLGSSLPPVPKQFKNTFYADGEVPVVCESDFPPIDISMSHAAGSIPNSGGWTNIDDPGPDFPPCPNPVATNNYALLISGGGTKETNYDRYYKDIKFLYRTLINDYKYDPTHIRVLMSDGLNDAADQLVINADGSKSYINSEQNLDGAGGDDVWGAADYNNISKALGAANGWSSLGSTNTLLIFTTGHGAQVDTANAGTNGNQVNLLLWQASPYSSTEKITDAQFASLLPANAKIILVMEQCYGGGFYNNVNVAGKIRSMAAAALGSQQSHSNDFSYPYITAVSQHDSAGNTMYLADTSPEDGLIQSLEAYTYANNKDPSQRAGTETPTNNPIGTGANALTLVTCGSGKSITSVAHTPSTWVAGQSGCVTWSQTGLTGQNVQIDIMKGASPGVRQATFGTAKVATLQTSTATVPTVMTSAPGGVTNDYWLRITTTGTLRPPVIGTSGTFTITGVTGGTPATLTINKDSTGKSSLITIIDNSNGKEVFPGFSTPHTYSLPGGSYTVTLSRSCTIPMVPQVIPLGSGAVVTKTYPLTDVSANDCKNDISTAEFGSIDISSLPDMGYHVYLKHASDPATLYQDIGSDTPTIWNVLPGDWTVKLEADGYMPGEQNVHVNAGDTTIVDFTLKKIDVNAQVLIVPQPLNIGRTGYFLAFVKLPTGNKAADVNAGKVYCEGAKALKVIRINLFPQIFVAIFQRQDLVPYVLPKDKVTLHVTGEIKKSTGNLVFMGSNTIKVISQKSTTKEDCDNVMSMTDTQVFTKFNKF